jgi:hypothetical protein
LGSGAQNDLADGVNSLVDFKVAGPSNKPPQAGEQQQYQSTAFLVLV